METGSIFIMHWIRSFQDSDKNIYTYGNAYELPSPHTEELTQMIWNTCREHGIMCMPEKCFSYLHQYPEKYVQQSLFMS